MTSASPWQDFGTTTPCSAELAAIIDQAAGEAKAKLVANLEAAIMGADLPFPPPVRTCPKCGGELD